jgi:hypothetical protein
MVDLPQVEKLNVLWYVMEIQRKYAEALIAYRCLHGFPLLLLFLQQFLEQT